MTVRYLNSFVRLVSVCLLLTCDGNYGNAQTTTAGNDITADTSHIRWVKQFPPLKGDHKGPGVISKIGEFIMGRKDPVLAKPVSILAASPDTFWILDQANGSLYRVRDNTGEIPRLRDKKLRVTPSLVGISSFSEKKILYTDSRLNKVFLYNPEKNDIRVLNDSLILEQPTGIAWSDLSRQIWVLETAAHRVSILNEKGELVKRFGKRGSSKGEFNFPSYIWMTKTGTAYIVDCMNFRVQVFNAEGEFQSSFGEIGDATGYFARPKGIAIDSKENIYIADALFHTVQIFDKSGKFLYRFGEQGRNKGQFWMPTGVYIDKNDYIYIADSYNSRVQVFQLIKGGDDEN